MPRQYILRGHEPVLEPDLLRWADWFEKADRIVGQDNVGPLFVSTVFLGLDHRMSDGPPVVFETMIFPDNDFGGELIQRRYCTWDEAERGHKVALRYAKRLLARTERNLQHDTQV